MCKQVSLVWLIARVLSRYIVIDDGVKIDLFINTLTSRQRTDLYLFSFYSKKTKSGPVVLATCTTPLSDMLSHPSMYKVPIRWYNLSLICIGWISGPDFASHWKVVKGVTQPKTWENDPFGGVCDLVHTQKMNFPNKSTWG